ncbi:MAG: class II fructose-bisphosphate aldolase [Lachnospiraceae bacterium]|nr:class II fructose-bisphosphate aldolase [Lachnospiraceae bacterium]
MGLVKAKEILEMAVAANTSALAFNCVDYNMLKSIASVAEELNKPTIMMLHPDHAWKRHWTTPRLFYETAKEVASEVKVPLAIHLDHCSNFDWIMAAIRAGFDSVMYDGSMLPVEENIRNTREVVKAAHAMGAIVEAELGHVGFASTVTDQEDTDLYTKPEVAAAFCEQSGCDSLAVAVGTAHGFYKETPKLKIDRLRQINAATDIPLVMHGGSGVPEDQLEVAFVEGINKFNIGTEFFYLYFQTMKEYCAGDQPNFFPLPALVQSRLQEYLRKKMLISKL